MHPIIPPWYWHPIQSHTWTQLKTLEARSVQARVIIQTKQVTALFMLDILYITAILRLISLLPHPVLDVLHQVYHRYYYHLEIRMDYSWTYYPVLPKTSTRRIFLIFHIRAQLNKNHLTLRRDVRQNLSTTITKDENVCRKESASSTWLSNQKAPHISPTSTSVFTQHCNCFFFTSFSLHIIWCSLSYHRCSVIEFKHVCHFPNNLHCVFQRQFSAKPNAFLFSLWRFPDDKQIQPLIILCGVDSK